MTANNFNFWCHYAKYVPEFCMVRKNILKIKKCQLVSSVKIIASAISVPKSLPDYLKEIDRARNIGYLVTHIIS